MIKSSIITWIITVEQKDRLEKIAKEDDRTVSYMISKIVKGYLDSQKEFSRNE